MTDVEQQPLFVLDDAVPVPALSEPEQALLSRFREVRVAEGAARTTVEAELSQLRTVRRELLQSGFGVSLYDVLRDPARAGRPLLEPLKPCSTSTMETRLRAVHRLLRLDVSPSEGRRRIELLDAALPPRASHGWHDAGVRVGGSRSKTGRRATVDPRALQAIFEGAQLESAEAGALAGLLCFTGLPLETICALRWSDLTWGADRLDCTVSIGSGRRRIEFFVTGPASGALIRLYVGVPGAPFLYVFPGRSPVMAITTRAVRDRLARWAREAGHAGVTRHGLVSALAELLRADGLDDASIQFVLGRRQTRTVDRMLKPHDRLASQRRVQASLASMVGSKRDSTD